MAAAYLIIENGPLAGKRVELTSEATRLYPALLASGGEAARRGQCVLVTVHSSPLKKSISSRISVD
jgi:hypothetical protein